MSANNCERYVDCCVRCHHKRASKYHLWCDTCWEDLTGEAQMPEWTSDQWAAEAAHLRHLLHMDAQPEHAQAVAR